MKSEFNLLDEPWIKVRTNNCEVIEVSIRDVILNSHEYKELAGESKTQDMAMLRFLLAIICTVFSRYDKDGNEIDLTEDVDFPVDNWEKVWRDGSFPQKPFDIYFNKWHDRFWLFDDKYPFYQSNAANGHGKKYNASKMIGTLFESDNKSRLFSDRFESGRSLDYAEAARWLLHLICFDDIAYKKPTPKRTWVSKLSLIAICGENLFQTLMLNYVADADARISNGPHENKPAWEIDANANACDNICISVPDNQAELLTLQSRYVYLHRDGNRVDGFYTFGGAYFEEKEVFAEQMTLWRGKADKGGTVSYSPRLFKNTDLLWQEFGSIAAVVSNDKDSPDYGKRRAGVLVWIDYLLRQGILPKNYFLNVSAVAVIYNEKQQTCLNVIDSISDGLTFHSQLLLEAGAKWRVRINEEIEKCSEAAKRVRELSVDLQKAAGASGDNIKGDREKALYYSIIDKPFRDWLAKLSTDLDMEECCADLERNLKNLTLDFGRQLTSRMLGKSIFESADGLNRFIGKVKKIFDLAGDENE